MVLSAGAEPARCSHLRPVQRNPLRRTGLVVAALVLDRSMRQALKVLQVLLVSGTDFADAEDGARARSSVTRLTAV